MAGLGGGRYGVNENITREQMARMLMEFARVQGYDTNAQADFANFAGWFAGEPLGDGEYALGSGKRYHQRKR